MGNDPGGDVNRRRSFPTRFIWFANPRGNARFRIVKFAIFRAFIVLALTPAAHAVVVLSGASNTTAPSGQPYFNNMGVVGDATGIYLGDRWVLSANHVAPSLPATVNFGGTDYATAAGSFQRIKNPGDSGLSTFTDIVLFRLVADPGLPTLNIAAGSPTVGTDVMMIGRGRTQEASPAYWQRTENPGPDDDIWTELAYPDPNINATGFKTTEIRTIRWGENNVAENGLTVDYGHGDVRFFTTTFDSGAKTHEAQGVAGDSGGGVFSTTDGGITWTLSGMMVAVSTYENQPSGSYTAVLGNETAMADLGYYRSEILQLIPEPCSALLGVIGCGAIVMRRRR